jgi:DNA invertase Pin-like site-specific DNA recombinase
MVMTKIGYTRVSSTDGSQTTDRQDLGDIKVFEDKASGKDMERPALQEMLAYIRKGDEVICHSIDRLARNLRDLEDIIKEVNSKGGSVTFITERLTFSGSDDAMSTLMLQMMGAFSQFERSMIKKRQAEGIAAAKARPDSPYKGRKPSIDRKVILQMLEAGHSIAGISRTTNISRQSVYRIKRDASATDALVE